MKFPRHFPLVLVQKVGWKKVRALGSEGGEIKEVECWRMRKKKEVIRVGWILCFICGKKYDDLFSIVLFFED
jgi:hypothetical protein